MRYTISVAAILHTGLLEGALPFGLLLGFALMVFGRVPLLVARAAWGTAVFAGTTYAYALLARAWSLAAPDESFGELPAVPSTLPPGVTSDALHALVAIRAMFTQLANLMTSTLHVSPTYLLLFGVVAWLTHWLYTSPAFARTPRGRWQACSAASPRLGPAKSCWRTLS